MQDSPAPKLYFLPHQPRWLSFAVSAAGTASVGIIDFFTSFDVSLSVFYALPVILAVWSWGRFGGVILALLTVGIWTLADHHSGHEFSRGWVPVWNACVRLGFLLLIVTGAYFTHRQWQQNAASAPAGALPICRCCKKIRDRHGAWLDLETYVDENLTEQRAQKLCPDCAKRVYIGKVSPRVQGIAHL